jgi:hypothetical protein
VPSSHFFFGCLQYPKIIVPSQQTLFLETTKVIRKQMKGTVWVFHFSDRFLGQKLLDRTHLMSWNVVMVENPIVGTKFRHFYNHNFVQTLQYFHILSLVDCLASWNGFKVNNNRDIEESDEHYLLL